jgi:hypothetical protein
MSTFPYLSLTVSVPFFVVMTRGPRGKRVQTVRYKNYAVHWDNAAIVTPALAPRVYAATTSRGRISLTEEKRTAVVGPLVPRLATTFRRLDGRKHSRHCRAVYAEHRARCLKPLLSQTNFCSSPYWQSSNNLVRPSRTRALYRFCSSWSCHHSPIFHSITK